MELTYVANVHEGVANINLFEQIGKDPETGVGISGQVFADEIRFLNEIQHVKVINVHINSPGGSVLEGMSIFTAIQNSKAPVNTFIEGIAASIAGVIAQAGKRRVINDFGRLMVHLPNINGDEEGTTSAQRQTLRNFKEALVKMFVNNTFKTSEEIEAIMTSETWFNADEALKNGFVDQVRSTSRQLAFISNDAMAVYNSAKEIIEIENKPIENTMDQVTNHLKLTKGANEVAVLEAVQNIEKEATTAKSDLEKATNDLDLSKKEVESLKTKITDLEKASNEANDAAAVSYVENAIKEGKFDEKKKDALIAQAKNDLPGFKTLTESIPAAHANIKNVINKGKDGEPTEKTLRELEKTDPAKVKDIMNSNPALYTEMYKAQYGVEPILS